MQLTRLAVLSSLPTAILSYVVLPEAAPFQLRPGVSQILASKPLGQLGHEVAVAPGDMVQDEVVFADDLLKITRLSPTTVSPPKLAKVDADDTPLPVIVWHGLGDSADAKGLKEVAALLGEVNPGTYVYLVAVGGGSGSADRQASFLGNVTQQLDSVCESLAKDNILRTAPAVDGLGFSQGGVFLRGYVERCNFPPMRSLITFGSPHNGIAEFQKCASTTDWVCQGANALLKSSTVWSDFIQSRLVPAQYYRDTKDFENYLKHSNYLADINNERALKDKSYAKNLASLEQFVMILFEDDKTLIPKESAWFAEFNETEQSVTPLRSRPIYEEDWIGLKQLDQKGGLKTHKLSGGHMQFDDEDLRKFIKMYYGPAGRSFDNAHIFTSAALTEERERLWMLTGHGDGEL
jgi:palmitoyl-protein thioesterase